jgi:hypothetical protein
LPKTQGLPLLIKSIKLSWTRESMRAGEAGAGGVLSWAGVRKTDRWL